MGFTKVAVLVKAPNGEAGYDAEFLVDSGAWDCMAPASELSRIGIKPTGRRVFELADGTRKEFPIGGAEIEILGEWAFTGIIFGPEGIEPLLGVTALESAGFELDPRTQRLKKLPAIPLK
ncbi:MAG: clan AA aspartic protease [Actinomycetota bacterium]